MTVAYTGTASALSRFFDGLPALLADSGIDPTGLSRDLQARLGVRALSLIQESFLDKSRGGGGADGQPWKPLAPSTIARRRLGRGDKKLVTQKARTRALTTEERKRFNVEKSKRAAKFLDQGYSRTEAADLALAVTVREMRKKGFAVQTKEEALGSRQVQTLVDTGLLLASLSPGVDNRPSGAPGQVFETPPGKVVVGTKQRPWHHTTDGSGRLPRRPFFPEPLPSAWMQSLLETARDGLAKSIAEALRGSKV